MSANALTDGAEADLDAATYACFGVICMKETLFSPTKSKIVLNFSNLGDPWAQDDDGTT